MYYCTSKFCDAPANLAVPVFNSNCPKLVTIIDIFRCLPDYPPDGTCLAENSQALQDLTDIEQVGGPWWVLKGQSCGQEGWTGGYDGYPCQHDILLQNSNGGWINNQTFCPGSDNECEGDFIVTIPNAYLVAPGVIRMDYPEGQGPLLPQIEDWKFISYPDPNWAFVIWCGSNPALEYNGALVLSRNRNLDPIPADVEAEFRDVASRLGIDYDLMCTSDNTNCDN